MNNIKIRQFTREDWNGWAGAEPFENGSEPLIFTANLSEVELKIIGDHQAVAVLIALDAKEYEMYQWMYLTDKWTPLQAEGEMRALIRALKLDENPHPADIAYMMDHMENYEFCGVC